ncbi:MAG: ABC transporter substrate-binding protein [Kineosporiaceae bacterium]
MNRRLGTAAALAAMALLVAGCTSGSEGGSYKVGEDTKTFEFWSFTGINQKAGVKEYTDKHPDVKVKLTEVGGSTETAQALTAALAGGKVPDLVLIQGDDLPKFMQSPDNFVDLTTLGADKTKNDYLDWVIAQSSTEDGKVIGIPTDVGGLAIAYRTDLFQAAGLPTDRDQVSALWPTWDKFLDVAKQYKSATGKAFLDNAATSVYFQAVNQGSERYYSPDKEPVYDTNPQVKDAFDLTVKFIESGVIAKQSTFSAGWTAAMNKGDYAVIAAPSWMLNAIRTNAPSTSGKWDIAKIPGGAGNWGGSYLAIPKRAKNVTAAWKYISEQQSPAGQLEHFISSGALPSTPSVYTDPKLTGQTDPFFGGAPVGKIYTESVTGLKPFYIGIDDAAIGTEFLNALGAVEQGKLAPDAAWTTALKNVKNAVDK